MKNELGLFLGGRLSAVLLLKKMRGFFLNSLVMLSIVWVLTSEQALPPLLHPANKAQSAISTIVCLILFDFVWFRQKYLLMSSFHNVLLPTAAPCFHGAFI